MKTQKRYEDFPCFQPKDIQKLGCLALDLIADEHIATQKEENNEPFCVFCSMRQLNSPYQIPCRHIMHEMSEILFSAEDLHPRYFNQFEFSLPKDNKIQTELIDDEKPRTYTDIMAEISPYASLAPRNDKIMNIFTNTIDDLHSIKKEISTGMPPTIEQNGRFPSHPSKNVILGGAGKSKRSVHCHYCHEEGHNIITCPKKKKDDLLKELPH